MIDDMTDLITIQELSAAGRNQECLQACQNALQTNPEVYYAYKYAGKSLLALGQFEKAQQYLVKAHQLDGSDPEIVKDIGNIFLNLSDTAAALEWYEKALEINNNYAPAINNIASLKRQSGNTQEAINLFKRAIHADSKLIQAYVGVAASFLAIGDIDQAESFAHQALAINENTPGINEILGIIFQNKNKPDQAVEFYQKELGINPKADNSFLNLGLLLLQKGQAADAAKSLSKASALAPSEQCSLLLAQAYQNLGQFKEAIVEYRKLDIDQSKNKIIPFNLGLCLLNTGNNIDAVEAFKIVIQLDESFIPAWTSIGNALMNEGRQQEALPAIHKALALDPNIQGAYLSLGGIYKNLGQLDQALSATLKSLELQPDNPDAYSNLGGIYLDLGRLDQALSSTLKSLELKPDNPGAYLNLGGIYKELGQLDQALAATLKSLELKPDNPGAYLNLGGIYKELGQLDQALASTLKTLEIEPDNPDAHINLGGIYKTLGQLDQALAATLRSLELKPDNQSAYLNLGGIYQELGQLDQALASTLKSLELQPDNPITHKNMGIILLEKGEEKDAINCFEKAAQLKPSVPNLCMSKLHFPRIAMSSWEIKEQRNNYLSHIKKIFRERNVKESDKNFIDLSLFMLTYQNGKDDKELLQEIGKIVHPWLEVKSKNETSAVADFRETDSKANQKRRIGFYFDNPHKGHVIFQHYFNLVKSINKENIDVALIKGPLASSKSSKELENYVSRTIQLPNNLRRSVEMIIKLKLDVLIYTEIHSSHAPYCLAHNRLAKVQMVLPGNSITTGIKTVDYFISSKYTETNASEENYTERLIKINGIPTGIEIKSHKVRKDICDIYGIPKDVNLVSLLHNPAKFHPDWDEILEEVAQKCYNTTFLVLDFSERSSSLLSERWEKYAPTLLEKSKFMKPMPKVDYLSLISFCDALLDPLHRGCGTTAYEALAKGIPIVTKPGLLARSRLVYGLYQIMNIKDAPIAYSNSDYIALCIEITSNKNKLLHLKSQIKSKFHKIISSNFRATEELANLLSEI